MVDLVTEPFPVNTHRAEPYKNFKFRVIWEGRVVAGISKVSALKQTVETVTHRQGNDPNTQHISPTITKFDAITMEGGVTHSTEFDSWARLVFQVGVIGQPSLRNFRRDIIIELLNEQGQPAKVYRAYNCWVSEYEMLPELDANSGSIAIESITIQNEGVERVDPDQEPTET